MFIASHEWLPAAQPAARGPSTLSGFPVAPDCNHSGLYRQLTDSRPCVQAREQAASFLRSELEQVRAQACEIPEAPQDLGLWMAASFQTAHSQYGQYLEQRKAGASRRFFSNRAHALYFLRCVAPTKLVDGAWLYGLLAHWRNPRFTDLVRTYLEELGEGAPDKNHVVVYRQLLGRYGLDPIDDLPDGLYRQGLIQLALSCNAESFLPEIIGFNLAYEQLPLHLPITAYELNELGLDPYYFTLHVTVDNGDTGHARRACQAVLDTLPRLDDGGAFWQRVREGSKLANAGVGTSDVIRQFDIEAELLRILAHKAPSGNGAHSNYCRVAGRSVNEWLSRPEEMPAFLQALQQAGWIKRGEPAANSRFWKLLQGERAEMFGVFSGYELQVIHDWIRGPASVDGQTYTKSDKDGDAAADGKHARSFRVAERLARSAATGMAPVALNDSDLLDSDLDLLKKGLVDPENSQEALLVEAMSPALHWTPAGLYATRLLCAGR
jgi:hypothetical protein